MALSAFALPNISSLAELLPYQKLRPNTGSGCALKDIQSAQQRLVGCVCRPAARFRNLAPDNLTTKSNLAVRAKANDVEDFLADIDADRGQGLYSGVHELLLRVLRASLSDYPCGDAAGPSH
jgi:hypothetical protein